MSNAYHPVEGGCLIHEASYSPDSRKDIVRRYAEELTTQGQFEVADQILAPDVRFYGPGQAEAVEGRRALIEFLHSLRGAFPDFRLEIQAAVAEEDLVAAWLTVHGTHLGIWRGIEPCGRRLALQVMNLFRFSGDFIIEVRAFFNVGDYITQLTGPSR